MTKGFKYPQLVQQQDCVQKVEPKPKPKRTFVSLCRDFKRWLGFHVHEWTKWEDLGNVVNNITNGVIARTQTRRCVGCGRLESRKVRLI
jgi:hypothetical protein